MTTTSWNGAEFDRRVPLESDEWVKPRNMKRHKNKKKFCRGIEGRAHSPIPVKNPWANGRQCGPQLSLNGTYRWATCYHYKVCQECGKRLSYSTEWSCAEYNENMQKKRDAEFEERMLAFRAKYHIKPH